MWVVDIWAGTELGEIFGKVIGVLGWQGSWQI